MTDIVLSLPTKVYFGENNTKKALTKEKKYLNGKVMILTTGRSLVRYGYLDDLCNLIKDIDHTSEITIFDGVSNNPDIIEIEEAVRLGKGKGISSVIGFGGGSAIDAAKAVAAGIGDDEDIREIYYEGKEPSDKTLPIIAIPTTAGTGSELSKAAIISSRENKIKAGIRGENIIPKVAIVNPEYTWTIPKNITIETGFDVLSHAIESYVSVKSNIHSEMLSEKAIKIVGEYLPRLYKNIDDHEARYNMSYASMVMGTNLKDVGTALPHRLQYPIGALTGTSHGVGLMSLYSSWIKYELKYNYEKIDKALRLLTEEIPDDDNTESIFNYFCSRIGGLKKLSELSSERLDSKELAEKVTGNIANDPISNIDGIIEKIYQESI